MADIVPVGYLGELEETIEVLADSDAVRALIEAREAVARGDVIRGAEAGVPCSMSGVTEFADPYEISLAPPARRAITSNLPPDVAAGAVEFITGPLVHNPYRLGKPLRAVGRRMECTPDARLALLYEIDEGKHGVLVLGIRHRANAYRPR